MLTVAAIPVSLCKRLALRQSVRFATKLVLTIGSGHTKLSEMAAPPEIAWRCRASPSRNNDPPTSADTFRRRFLLPHFLPRVWKPVSIKTPSPAHQAQAPRPLLL